MLLLLNSGLTSKLHEKNNPLRLSGFSLRLCEEILVSIVNMSRGTTATVSSIGGRFINGLPCLTETVDRRDGACCSKQSEEG